MSADTINVALVGCGRIADLHAPGLLQTDGARLYGVCDLDPEVAAARQAEWGADRSWTDFDQVLADPAVDAVEVLTPQTLHEAMVIAALRAGKHVAVQKPITIDLPSADRMVAAAEASGRVFKVTENYVFYPPIVRAKALLEAGAIGEPIGLRIKLLSGPTGGWEVPASAWQWRVEEAAAGRGFTTFDHGHHLWSTAWYLMGEVERVVAWIDSIDGVVDCPAVVMWKHTDAKRYGTCDLIHATELNVPSRYYSNDEWIEVTGTRGVLVITRCTGDVQTGPPLRRFDGERWIDEEDLDADWGAGFVGATRNFLAAIRGEAAPLLDGRQGREILRFALAIQRSARERREVFLEELDRALPGAYSWRRRRQQIREAHGGGLLERLGIGANLTRYAPQALALTRELATSYDPAAAEGVETVIGLHLTPDGGVEERLGLIVRDGQVELVEGSLPEDALLSVRMPAGVWAAILLKKKRIEAALFQGKIQFEGKAEEALKLRDLFGF